MVLPASHKVSRVSWYSGAELIIIIFIYGTITPYGPTFQLCSINHDFSLCSVRNPRNKFLVWALSFSLAATKKIDFSFSSSRYLDVSVPWVYLHKAMYSLYDTWGFPCEFPHSEIFGSLTMCVYPKLIAAYRVLHRLLEPRHSPYTLSSLTIFKLETRTDACSRLLSNTRKSMHTACVWSEKTTVCRIFSCQRIRLRPCGLRRDKPRCNLSKTLSPRAPVVARRDEAPRAASARPASRRRCCRTRAPPRASTPP